MYNLYNLPAVNSFSSLPTPPPLHLTQPPVLSNLQSQAIYHQEYSLSTRFTPPNLEFAALQLMGRISSIKTQITPSKFSYWEPFHLSLVNGAGLGTCGLFNHTQPTIAIFLSSFNFVTKYHSTIMSAHSAPLSNAKDLSSDEGGYYNLTNWVVRKVRKRICIGLPNSRRGREERKERKKRKQGTT